MAASATSRPAAFKPHSQVELDDHYLIALAKQGRLDAYDRIVKRYYGFVRLKASSYFLIGGDADDLIQEGLVGLYKAVRDYRTDRESSFRNFAELCITRQIITAVKTASRNKHAPLNQYVSFGQTPAAAGDSETTLEEILPGPPINDPANQVIATEAVATPALGEVSRGAEALESVARNLNAQLPGLIELPFGEVIANLHRQAVHEEGPQPLHIR